MSRRGGSARHVGGGLGVVAVAFPAVAVSVAAVPAPRSIGRETVR
jgi:hypothetical protein